MGLNGGGLVMAKCAVIEHSVGPYVQDTPDIGGWWTGIFRYSNEVFSCPGDARE